MISQFKECFSLSSITDISKRDLLINLNGKIEKDDSGNYYNFIDIINN